jgi:hypothetical protein
MIFNLKPSQTPAMHLPHTTQQIAAEVVRVRRYLERLEQAKLIFSQPLDDPLELEVVIPEEDPSHARGWATGTDLANTYRQAIQVSGGRRGRPHVFLNFGTLSIAVSPIDMEDESRMQFGQHIERSDVPGTVVWTISNRGSHYLLRPQGQ